MMHQSTDKIKRIFIYILIFLFASTIFNFQILNPFLKLFKINKIEIKNIAYQKEFNFFEGQNIFNLNKRDVINVITKFPNIEKYKINKIYPNQIRISLFETKPIGKIFKNNELFIIGSNGKIFKGKDGKNLPLIEGTLEMNKINNFLKKIQLSTFSLNKMEKLVYYPSNRWDVIFNDKTILKFPSEQITTNIKRAEILLRTKDFKSKVIDLRIKDKLILYNE